MEVEQEFARLAPWITQFRIDGKVLGGDFKLEDDPRVGQFFAHFPDAREILELGCLEGGHSVGLAGGENVRRVLAVDARAKNIERAELVKRIFQRQNLLFVEGDVERMNLSALGKFDAVFCSGLLYHLREPWRLVEQCAAIADGIFIWTHYTTAADETREGWSGQEHLEGGVGEPRSGLDPTSFWLTRESLLRLTTAYFPKLEILAETSAHEFGSVITIAAKQ